MSRRTKASVVPILPDYEGILSSRDHEGTNRGSTNIKDQVARLSLFHVVLFHGHTMGAILMSGDNDTAYRFLPLLSGSLKFGDEDALKKVI
nr:ornithine aminotransferase, mitochondrial [Tanacetum cinerariifolium]